MAKTLSIMPELGRKAANFCLKDVNGELFTLDKFNQNKPMLVMFICNHCPFVVHVIDKVVELAKKFQGQGLDVVAIKSNDVENFPEDSPENMKIFSEHHKFSFPYLFDESQEVAKAYDAACTPDFFLFDVDKKLFYRGQMDFSRPGNEEENDGKDLICAVESVLQNKESPKNQRPSMGCNIKWK